MKFNDSYFNRYNWNEIQDFYNQGHSWKEILKKFHISNTGLCIAIKKKLFKTRGRSESLKLYKIKNPQKHSEETKKKISEIRKKYLQENPDKVPYKLNHSSRESYPEKYFTELFKSEGINVIKSFHIGLYELDFCILDKKIDIEIDGSQHYYDEKVVESDKRRNKFLEDNGWDIVRINWSEYQKFNSDDKKDYIFKLKSYINNLIETKPLFEIKNKKEHTCKYCGNGCSWKKDRCESCYHIQSRKVERPSLEQLKDDIEKLGYTGTGKKYGVSDNSVRKWLKTNKNKK